MYGVSDVHTDKACNMSWLHSHCMGKGNDTFTVFLLPGDVAEKLSNLEAVFSLLTSRYDAVCFVAGNHDLWKINGVSDSVFKWNEIVHRALKHKVHLGPLRIASSTSLTSVVTIHPLHSWYHSSFDTDPDLDDSRYLRVESEESFATRWADFYCCVWPNEIISVESFRNLDRVSSEVCDKSDDPNAALALLFAAMNEPFLRSHSDVMLSVETPERHVEDEERVNSSSSVVAGTFAISAISPTSSAGSVVNSISTCSTDSLVAHPEDTIISFSHFLPLPCLLPEKRFLFEPLLARVCGSTFLGDQVSRLKPHLHLFGHTHIPMDITVDGTRFVQWPLGHGRWLCVASLMLFVDFILFLFLFFII